MALAEKAFSAFFTQRNLGGTFSINAQDEPISQIGAKLHRHDIRIRPLSGEYKRNAGRTGLHAQSSDNVRDGIGIVRVIIHSANSS